MYTHIHVTIEQQRLPHKTEPVEDVSKDKLISLGVLFWEGLHGVDDPRVKEIQEERGYTYSDVITCSPEKLPGYETKILSFFEEHIHTDEEIRFCVDGSGYFDIRDEEDK
jgi:1,2-dihydroxy-3-keto-5-methylthiopentene dioxygenase